MSALLPKMPYARDTQTVVQNTFRGYQHTESANEEMLYDMENLSADAAPLLSVRKKRCLLATIPNPLGLYIHDAVYYVSGVRFCRLEEDGQETILNPGLPLSDTEQKKFAELNGYIVIYPDKLYYHPESNTFGRLEESYTGTVTFRDGVYAQVYAQANTIVLESPFSGCFRVGDAVEISGCEDDLKPNNGSFIIREIEDNKYLRFYENSFFRTDTPGTYAHMALNISIKRALPDMDFLFECENRIWGCKDNDIFASKLGDPFNFYAYDGGISSGSYWVQAGSEGKFTGACSFLGYPTFFKERHIYKIHGSRPSNYQMLSSASRGVAAGSGQSTAIAGDRLFYLSPAGMTVYSGGIPADLSACFGGAAYQNAVAGSNGTKYYAAVEDLDHKPCLFVYDTLQGIWHKETCGHMIAICFSGLLYLLEQENGNGRLWAVGDDIPAYAVPEAAVESCAVFGPCVYALPGKIHLHRIHIQADLKTNAELEIQLSYDNGPYEVCARFSETENRTAAIPLIPRRCGHFTMRLAGKGQWIIRSISREYTKGSWYG